MRMYISIETDKWTFVARQRNLSPYGGQRGRKYFSNKKIQKCKCISSSGVSRKRKTYRHYRRITKPIGWTAPAIMTDTTDTWKDEVWREGKSDMVNGSSLVKKKKVNFNNLNLLPRWVRIRDVFMPISVNVVYRSSLLRCRASENASLLQDGYRQNLACFIIAERKGSLSPVWRVPSSLTNQKFVVTNGGLQTFFLFIRKDD